MSDNFGRSVAFVLEHEGAYVNDPRDPGGETKFGISKRAYPHLDIKNLTEVEAAEIYRRDYWMRAGCDTLNWPLSLVVFDTAVNMGVKRAMELGVKAGDDWREYLFLRLEHYSALSRGAAAPFLRGWVRRVIDLYRDAKG